MELVYLWVEDYKNIHEQGFNFSPKFECKYENNKLTIIEKKEDEYIKNFFGDNVNVTAIVGKNGSGKSSLLDFIYYSFHFHDATILIFKKDDKFFSISKQKINYITKNKVIVLNENSEELNNCIFPLFDYSFKKSFYIKSDRFPIFPPKYSNGKFNFLEEERKNIKMILKNYIFMNQVNKWNLFDSYFKPRFIIVKTTKLFKEMESSPNEIQREIITELNKKAYEYFQNKESKKGFNCLRKIGQLPIDVKKEMTKKDYLKRIKNTPKEDLTNELYQKNLYDYSEFKEAYKYETVKINENELDILTEEYEDDKSIFIWDINELTQNEVDLILNLFSFSFNIEIFDEYNKYFNQLSYGERQLLIILNKIFEFLLDNKIKNYLCFFDEIDMGFHPDWQKKVLSFIIEFLKLVPEKKFHLVFSSHSPFLLSDIPKENIIFLDTYKKEDKEVKNEEQKIGNCKIADGLKQTFGANIHTLLSDSFFIEGGLMGEFAKQKINEIIENLKDKKYNPNEQEKEQLLLTIESIGEPFLKQKLSKMYFDKFDTKKEERIKELKAELKRLEI